MNAKKIAIFTIFVSFLSVSANAAIDFTGDVVADFSAVANCWEDPQDNYPAGTGFDIERVCFYYDGQDDTLSVGIHAFDSAIIGDADGDGNPNGSADGGVTDFAELGGSETYVISFDLDGDSVASAFDFNTVDLMVGVSAESDITTFGAYLPSTSFNPDYPGIGFGVEAGLTVDLFTAPSMSVADLEFTIQDFTSLDLEADYAPQPVMQVFAASVSAGGVGSDFLPSSSELYQFYPVYDFDEDGLQDWEEFESGTDPLLADSDSDGLPDGIELNSENPTDPLNDDTDGDGLLDGEEDLNANGVLDEGESNPNDTDTDNDGLGDDVEVRGDNPTNPNDADSDDDGLLDGQEDTNKNGRVDDDETDPNNADTDNGGVNDFVEVQTGYDPLDPTDDTQAEMASVRNGVGQGYDRVQGGGLFGCQLNTQSINSAPVATTSTLAIAVFLFVAYVRQYRKHS